MKDICKMKAINKVEKIDYTKVKTWNIKNSLIFNKIKTVWYTKLNAVGVNRCYITFT